MTQDERAAIVREVQWNVRVWMCLQFPAKRVTHNELVNLGKVVSFALDRALGTRAVLSPPTGAAAAGGIREPPEAPRRRDEPTARESAGK